MKKSIALILALVLCLSLAACSGGETPNTDDNRGTEQNKESTGGNTGPTEHPYANHPWLVHLYGQWELIQKEDYVQDEEIPCSAVTVNEDKTCVVDGVSGTWELSADTNEHFLKIDIFMEGEHRFTAAYYDDHKAIGVWTAGYNGPVDTSWINATTTEAITLTTENWRDYFELVTEPRYDKNAFGDVERLVLIQYLTLKEEYANVVYENDVVVEIASTANRYYITLDAANESYTLGEMIEEVELTEEVRYLDSYNNVYTIDVFSNNYINVKDHADPDIESSKKVILVSSIEDIEFLRVQGTIYVAKP